MNVPGSVYLQARYAESEFLLVEAKIMNGFT